MESTFYDKQFHSKDGRTISAATHETLKGILSHIHESQHHADLMSEHHGHAVAMLQGLYAEVNANPPNPAGKSDQDPLDNDAAKTLIADIERFLRTTH